MGKKEKKMNDNDYELSDFDTEKKSKYLKIQEKVKCNDFGDHVYRFQLTYDEIIDILDLKYLPTKKQAIP